MTITPFDIGTYLVRSHGHTYLVDIMPGEYFGCPCDGWQFSAPINTCSHVREVIRQRVYERLPMIVAMKGRIA